MKSAQEFCDEYNKRVEPYGYLHKDFVHRIQADALLEAANIVNEARGEEFDLRSIRDSIKAKAQELGQPL